jgi:hypothetical protein
MMAASGFVLACVGLLAVVILGYEGHSTPLIPSLEAASRSATGPGLSDGDYAVQDGPTPTQPSWYTKQQVARERQKAFEATLPSTTTTRQSAATTAANSPTASLLPTAAVGTNGSTQLRGVWSGAAQRLADYLLADSPTPDFTIPVLPLAELYVRYAEEVGLRADVLWGQMLHETGFGRYGGDVLAAQNNFAGIGATGGGEPGYSFPTAEEGVKAHIAHMVAYVFTEDQASWTNASVDPRYDSVKERGVALVLSDLDGRWAVPGIGYGAAIERHVAAINR